MSNVSEVQEEYYNKDGDNDGVESCYIDWQEGPSTKKWDIQSTPESPKEKEVRSSRTRWNDVVTIIKYTGDD